MQLPTRPDDLLSQINTLRKNAENMPLSRNLSMVLTKLDEARLWAEEIKRVEQ